MILLKFAQQNKDIFEKIKAGRKKVETRAATERYRDIKSGDEVVLMCGRSKITKTVTKISRFRTIAELLKKYTPGQINPGLHTYEETVQMYHSFPGYKEKIEEFGLIALELK
ncbi:MAG TPA: ASCH domain-containing protein [Candidatus Paceibacterota bacterium]|nr:ASCH domain-containing protein [Candidatus Paceibacterota bacterium]